MRLACPPPAHRSARMHMMHFDVGVAFTSSDFCGKGPATLPPFVLDNLNRRQSTGPSGRVGELESEGEIQPEDVQAWFVVPTELHNSMACHPFCFCMMPCCWPVVVVCLPCVTAQCYDGKQTVSTMAWIFSE